MKQNLIKKALVSIVLIGGLLLTGNSIASANVNHNSHSSDIKTYHRSIKLNNEKVSINNKGTLYTNKHHINLNKLIDSNNYAATVSKKSMTTKFYKVTKNQKRHFSQSVKYYVNIYGKGFNEKGWLSSKYVHFNKSDEMKNTPLYATHP
ncbi:hypothetical protein MOO46_05825 [Apilactobacillus apisilvae]|uniref:Surface layer protein A domain-containing protein n=1 Tax=Apilactobacillus apisilvae TaxID=2923364 RepID=A0ABY4PH92_9LACO|nr:hypothetical protein [Apilactobacillus apisilvae]UQS84762.1 hypothetical protein MOO46_05825 [Apilactobacillus apisilvae]